MEIFLFVLLSLLSITLYKVGYVFVSGVVAGFCAFMIFTLILIWWDEK